MSKKSFYTLCFLVIFSACDQAKDRNAGKYKIDAKAATNFGTPAATLDEYEFFVSSLDTFDVETTTVAARKYQELFGNKDLDTKDRGFVIFNIHYERLDKNVNELHEKDTTNFDPLILVDAGGKSLPVPQKLKAYNDRLKRNGFEVSSTEGVSYIQQDRDFIAKWFYRLVSPTMKEYLQQLNKENKEGFQEDAGLTIEAKQYVNRLIWWDKFIFNNPKFLLIDEAKEHRKYLLTFFLIGMDNSPVLDYETNKLDGYYKEAYTYLDKDFPNSETNTIVSPYFEALLQGDSQKAGKILNDYEKKGMIIDFGEGL